MPGSGIRLVMTANGPNAGLGTGANLDISLGSFTSLVSLFATPPTVYATPQPGLPAQWWANANWAAPNQYVAYTRPLTTPQSAWFNAVPGGAGQEPNCLLQGINVGV
jgi:hypothetical protein